MKDKQGLGLIGAGRIGTIHAKNVSFRIEEGALRAISDPRLEAAKELGKRCGVSSIYKNYQRLLEDEGIEGILICSPTDTHAQIIEEAAAAGKDIFCEKPIALELEEIDRSLQAVEGAGVKFQLGLSRRFDPSFSRAQKEIAEGKIGTPQVLKITSRDPEPPPIDYVKSSGGLFMDMTIHDFDMARFVMGQEVVEVHARGSVLIDPEIGQAGDVDTAITTLRFENGALGTIDNSRRATYGYDQRLEVLGSEGKVSVSNRRVDRVEVADEKGKRLSPSLPFFTERYGEAYLEEMREFVRCLTEDEKPPVSGEDGRAAALLARAAESSCREGRPVKVEEVG